MALTDLQSIIAIAIENLERDRERGEKRISQRKNLTTTATTAAFAQDSAEVAPASSPHEIAISLPPDDHLSTAIDAISGSIADQVFEFCEADLFQDTLQNSEVTSRSQCFYDENSSHTANFTFPSEQFEHPNENFNGSTATSSSTITTVNNNSNNNFSLIFDSQDEFGNDISATIDFSTSPPFSGAPYVSINQQDQLDFSTSQYPHEHVIPFMGPPLPSVYQERCLPIIPPFFKFNPSAPPSFFDSSMGYASMGVENSGGFNGNMMLVGSEIQPKDEMLPHDQLHKVYNSSDSQSISNDNNNQPVVNGAVSTPPLSTEISNMEDSNFKPGKLSAEQRKEKIQRYMKKRNERNFSKKIKYACRKTLADSRPRVRGRFAKNDDSGDRFIKEDDDDFDDVHACVSSLLHHRSF